MGRAGHRGHSLLEMILAAILFSSVAVGILAVWVMQHKAITKSGNVLVAQYLGERLMEECIAAKFEGVDFLAGPTSDMNLREVVKNQPKVVVYKGNIIVTPIQVQPGLNDTKLVVVNVSWEGNDGISSIEYRTYLQEKG
jgi:type II secretory pathway pseudopilin PulG